MVYKHGWLPILVYRQVSNISRTKSQDLLLVSSCSCLYPIRWSQVLSWEWRCSWSSADRRCTNYIWVIYNLIAHLSASYITDLTVRIFSVGSRLITCFFCFYSSKYVVGNERYIYIYISIYIYLSVDIYKRLLIHNKFRCFINFHYVASLASPWLGEPVNV